MSRHSHTGAVAHFHVCDCGLATVTIDSKVLVLVRPADLLMITAGRLGRA